MFPLVLLVFLTGSMVFSICRYKKASYDDGALVLAVISGLLLGTLLIAWPSIYFGTLGSIAKMEAFLAANKSAYEYTIAATEKVEIKAVTAGKHSLLDIGALTYQKLGSTVGERIKELREKVTWYNETLQRYRRWNRCWFSKEFVADVPDDLKWIVIK